MPVDDLNSDIEMSKTVFGTLKEDLEPKGEIPVKGQ